MRLQRRPKTPQIKQIYGCVGLYFLSNPIVDILKKYWAQKYSHGDLLQSTELVKTRLDKPSTVVVEVASFVGDPVGSLFKITTLKST